MGWRKNKFGSAPKRPVNLRFYPGVKKYGGEQFGNVSILTNMLMALGKLKELPLGSECCKGDAHFDNQ